jgi:predicted nucleotidyltransferase
MGYHNKNSMKKYGFETYRRLIERFIKEIKESCGDNFLSLVLFGSVARGEAGENSDIDILVLMEVKGEGIEKKFTEIGVNSYDWEENIELRNKGIRTKIYEIVKTEEELRENPLILLDILDHGIILYDPKNRMKNILKDFEKKLKELGAEKIIFSDGKWAWDLKPDWKKGEIVEIKL